MSPEYIAQQRRRINRGVYGLLLLSGIAFAFVLVVIQSLHHEDELRESLASEYHQAMSKKGLELLAVINASRLWFRDVELGRYELSAVQGDASLLSLLHADTPAQDQVSALKYEISRLVGEMGTIQAHYADPEFEAISSALENLHIKVLANLDTMQLDRAVTHRKIDDFIAPLIPVIHQLQRLHEHKYRDMRLSLDRLHQEKRFQLIGLIAALAVLGLFGVVRMVRHVHHAFADLLIAQTHLQESEQYNRMLFEQSPLGLALCRMNGELVDINPAYARIIGCTIEETLTLGYWDITPQSYVADEQCQLESLENTGRYGPYEKEYIHKDGHRVPVRLHGSIQAKDGESCILSSIEDITEQTRVEEALRESQAMLQVVLDSIPERVFWKDRDSVYLGCNQHFATDAGLESARQIVGKNDFELSWCHQAESYQADDRQVIQSGVPKLSFEEIIILPDGNRHWVKTSKVPLRDPDGSIGGVIGIFFDITEQKLAETELANYREHLEELVTERTRSLRNAQDELVRKGRLATLGQLTATVSHELRNPLGAMRPSLYIIEKHIDSNNARLQQAIERIDRNIDRCDRIIDELLDFTRITELHLSATRIDEWLESVIDEQVIPAGIQVEKNLSLKDVELPVDRDRLRRAVINVVENACHAMLENDQLLKARKGSRLDITTGGHEGRVEIKITDSGPGIPEEVREKIFEPLFSTKSFGVGLGMSAVKQIMQQHGGGIEIETAADHGTSITLWLPGNTAGRDDEEVAA